MTFDELNEDQRLELKQRILTERNEQKGEGTSYGELADADDLVSDEDLKDWYGGTEFSPDDFMCSTSLTPVKGVPQWAVNYLVYGDDSGLAPDDIGMVDRWVEGLRSREGLELLCLIDGSENEFSSSPAFGPACGTVDFMAKRAGT